MLPITYTGGKSGGLSLQTWGIPPLAPWMATARTGGPGNPR